MKDAPFFNVRTHACTPVVHTAREMTDIGLGEESQKTIENAPETSRRSAIPMIKG